MRLILASGSPRRADLLRSAGIEFDVCVTQVDEQVLPGETPTQYVRRLAAAKSAAVAKDHPRTLVLGADTIVVVDGQILGKPEDELEAERMLRRLAGRAHEVLTGVSLRRGTREACRVVSTTVHFVELTDAEIEWYAASGEGGDKAGAYAAQGLGSRFVSRIEGSYTNVVGLPMSVVYEMLTAFRAEA